MLRCINYNTTYVMNQSKPIRMGFFSVVKHTHALLIVTCIPQKLLLIRCPTTTYHEILHNHTVKHAVLLNLSVIAWSDGRQKLTAQEEKGHLLYFFGLFSPSLLTDSRRKQHHDSYRMWLWSALLVGVSALMVASGKLLLFITSLTFSIL